MAVCLYVLLVIHNRTAASSPSCERLRTEGCTRVVVCDNSTREMGIAAYCEQAGFAYLSMGGNRGLSKAYNRGIDYLLAHTDATHVLLLDDDTTLPQGFLDNTAAAIAREPDKGIFLPRVYDEIGLLSPCAIRGLHVSRVSREAELTQADVTGINSGMAIALSLFAQYRYDEGYFLDYIDHAFLRDMKARGVQIAVTDQTLSQRFAGNDRSDKAAAKRRLALFSRDFRRFCGPSLKGRLYSLAVITRRRLRLL